MLKTLWIVRGQVGYEAPEMLGIFDSEDKAKKAKASAEKVKYSWGCKRFDEVWVDQQKLNESIKFETH